MRHLRHWPATIALFAALGFAGALPAAVFALGVHVIFELLERAVTPGFVPPK